MRFGPRAAWHGKYPCIVARHQSLDAALDVARFWRRTRGALVWIAAAGAPSTRMRAARGKP